jgi:hypothetical protein
MFQISDLQDEYNMSTGEIEDLLNEQFDSPIKQVDSLVNEATSLAEKQMERAEEIRDERREDGISD